MPLFRKSVQICISALFCMTATAQNRFPKPDFESGYQYPEITYPIPNEMLWSIVDIVMLVVLMSIVAWAVIKRRTRKPVIWVSILSVAYFGFFRY